MQTRRIRMIIEYDGSDFVGWQTQPNGPSVQAALQAQLFAVTGASTHVHGAGRTDSGVHARAQVAHFDTPARMPAEKFAYALNVGLPPSIRVLHTEETNGDFHARFDARRKHYRYALQLGPHRRVFTRHTALHAHAMPDMALLTYAADLALGEHDFRAFKAANSTMENTVRHITRSQWTKEGNMLYYDVEGNGFLYNMVRILVGTMLAIGKGLLVQETMAHALSSKKREDAGPTAPAHGLTMMRIVYPDFDTADYVQL